MSKAPLESIAPIKVQSVADHVVEQLEKLIDDRTFAPGDKLPAEHDLAVALQVGRSTVREAKQILLAKGLLVVRGRAGTFVAASHDRDNVTEVIRALGDPTHVDINEVREVIEIPAIRFAAQRATEDQIAAMRATMADIEYQTVEQKTQAWERSLDIHRQIVRASNNRVLSSLYDLIAQVLLRTQVPFLPYIADWSEEVAAHRRLIDVIADGDPEAAAKEMSRHLRHSDQYRQDLLEADAEELRRGHQAPERLRTRAGQAHRHSSEPETKA